MRLFIYILLLICFSSCKKATQPALSFDEISLNASFDFETTEVAAGESIKLRGTIDRSNNNQMTLELIVQHALYHFAYPITTSDKEFKFEIPGSDNQLAGEVNAKLNYKGKSIYESKYFITPGVAKDKMQNFNGPKDLFASDDDASMNVSIPHDEFDNPMLPPTEVEYQASFEGTVQSLEEKPVENLVAYQITNSKSKKGKYLIGSKSSDGFSQEQELIIGAAMPQRFTIELLSFHPFADSRQFIQLRTSVLKDKFNNIVSDGTLINFSIYNQSSLVGVYQSFTIGGIANVYIENPSKEVEWTIQASLHDEIVSNKIQLSFAKNVNDFRLRWNNRERVVEIGPVVGILGQFVPDGTEVRVSSSEKNLVDYIYLEEGKYNYKLPFDWIENNPKQLEILIGGHEKIIELD